MDRKAPAPALFALKAHVPGITFLYCGLVVIVGGDLKAMPLSLYFIGYTTFATATTTTD
jgi:hypothetical protein